MTVKFNKGLAAAIFGAVLTAGLGWSLLAFPFGRSLISSSYDWLLVLRGQVAAREAVVVYLDEISFQKLGQPLNAPWDRTLHARLIDRLTAAGARAVVFDIVFSDPDRANPAADEQLSKTFKANGRVILAADNVRIGPKTKQTLRPFDLFMDSAAGVGSAEVVPDSDLVVRTHTPEEQLQSLSWAAAELVDASATKQASQSTATRWMNYYGPPNSLLWKSYYEALDPALVSDDFFRNKVVFIGARINTKFAGERKDEYVNPFGAFSSSDMTEAMEARFIPGVEIQATAFLNLLRGDWLVRWKPATEEAIIITAGLLFGFGFVRLRPAVATVSVVTALAIVGLFGYFMFRGTRIWFPWLIVATQIGIAFFWSITFNSIQLYVQKRLLEQTISLYLSPKLVKKFSREPAFLKPGAEEHTISILFTDIEDFTVLSQGISTDALAKLMNKYFHMAVSQCIHKTDGTVVKYIGDAVFAFWNAPELQSDHEYRACEAALRFRDAGKEEIDGKHLHTRLGIHTGSARVGNFGSPERVDYTALGESVNLASRLEGLNKYLGTDCVISGETRKGLGDRLVSRPLGQFQLKGFEKPVEVHEIVGWPDQAEATLPWRESFAQALNNYQQRNLEFAELGFRRTLELKPDDGPSKFYLAKLEELATQELPEKWVTHTILKEK